MFAVPGWKVSADKLKTQVDDAEGLSKGSKKRKRKQKDGSEITTQAAPGDLRSSLGIDPPTDEKQKSLKKQKREDAPQHTDTTSKHQSEPEDQTEKKPRKKDKKDKKKHLEDQEVPQAFDSHIKIDARSAKPPKLKGNGQPTSSLPPPPPPSSTKLTPMQSAMRQKLVSARFRYLNEMLYTTRSKQASSMFDENPSFFDEYHSGFRQQVSTWPENPVDVFTRELQHRGRVFLKKGGDHSPVPRSSGICTIADLGCGDAKLSEQVSKKMAKDKIKVLSFDLQAPNERITKADIANLPLGDGSINVAVFCLALMGQNWIDFIEEAYRILHWKGELWIAEIKSRFARGKKQRVEHSVGNRKKKPPTKEDNQRRKVQENKEASEQLAVEVDGEEAKEETDVSAFIAVLRRRGFALYDEDSIDMSNKMFVRMRFSKSLPAIKGKNVGKEGKPQGAKPSKAQFIPDEDEEDEAMVLKPCLYKIR